MEWMKIVIFRIQDGGSAENGNSSGVVFEALVLDHVRPLGEASTAVLALERFFTCVLPHMVVKPEQVFAYYTALLSVHVVLAHDDPVIVTIRPLLQIEKAELGRLGWDLCMANQSGVEVRTIDNHRQLVF